MDAANLMARNHLITLWCGRMLTRIWGTESLVDESMIACMVSIRVPGALKREDCGGDSCAFSSLHDVLLEQYGIEVPVFTFRASTYIRVSIHVYNTKEECLKLAAAVLKIRGYALTFSGFELLKEEQKKIKING